MLKERLSKSLPQSLKRPLSKINIGVRGKHLCLDASSKASKEKGVSGLLIYRKGLTAEGHNSALELQHIFPNGSESKKVARLNHTKAIKIRIREGTLRISCSLTKLDKMGNI